MVHSFALLSYELPVSLKENPDIKRYFFQNLCIFYQDILLWKYFINIYVRYYLCGADSTAAVISLQFIKSIQNNYLETKFWNSETTTSLWNSPTFLQAVRKSLKHSKLDFKKSKHFFVRIQFIVIDFG